MTDSALGSESAFPLCTRCGEYPSNHHIFQITDANKEVLELCDECASDWNKNSVPPSPGIRNATCFYCGAPALTGSLNQEWEKKSRGLDFHFTCTACFENYSRLLLQSIETMPTDIPAEFQIEKMSKAIGEIDEQVREAAGISKS